MKKILFGIVLILFSMSFCIFGEISHIIYFSSELAETIYILFPIIGLIISVWGLFEKDK